MTRFAAQTHPRLVAFLLCCLLAVFLFAFFSPAVPTARAQDNPPAEGSDAAKAAEASKSAEQPKQSANIFMHIIKSLSWFAPIMLIVSIALIALIMLLIMELRMAAAIPPSFVEEFTDTVNKRRFKEAFEMARQDNSYLAKVLSVGMARLQYGIEDAREAAMNTVESIKASKEQLITYLATIGTLGPLFGLVGTVYSMIGAFMKMSDKAKQVDPHDMADTLSHG